MMLSCCDGNYAINFLTIDNIGGRKRMDYTNNFTKIKIKMRFHSCSEMTFNVILVLM
jgi:hypothetical protein